MEIIVSQYSNYIMPLPQFPLIEIDKSGRALFYRGRPGTARRDPPERRRAAAAAAAPRVSAWQPHISKRFTVDSRDSEVNLSFEIVHLYGCSRYRGALFLGPFK